ncbi:hypothetical protein [Streptomyces aureocirculatus]|uniref:hypothetical protein n=1 Tax=Streptomyces aureocirculatus TaxID=67275 RepID=UPI0004CB61CC|nr:hypothetical protein [Streptomyces aureocirculatus]
MDVAHAVGVAVLRQLEPSVERLLERHLATARDWLPHQFVPWSAARDFDGPVDGAACGDRLGEHT